MAELRVLRHCAQLPEEWALLECCVSIRVPAAGRMPAGSGGPQRLQVWALGLQATVGHLQSPCRARRFHSWESWPEQVVSCKDGVRGADLSLLWEPQALFRNPAFTSGISCGEAGSALEGGESSDRMVGPRRRNGWCEVCPASLHPSVKCVLSSADFCCPGNIPLSFW